MVSRRLLGLMWWLGILGLAAGCSQELRSRIRDGDIQSMKRYTVAGKTFANNERWLPVSTMPLAGNSLASKTVLVWLDTFKPAKGVITFDPAIRVDFLTGITSEDYGVYLNKKANLCYVCTPAYSGLSSGIYQCDPKAFGEVDKLLLDQPGDELPEAVGEVK